MKYFNHIKADIDEFLFCELPGDYYEAVKQWMIQAHRTHFNNVRSRQQNKFERLWDKHKQSIKQTDTIVPVTDSDKENLRNKWVINLSQRSLTDAETSLLQKGMNFAVAPKSIPINEYIIGIENACRFLGHDTRQAETLRSECVKIIKNSNPPPAQHF